MAEQNDPKLNDPKFIRNLILNSPPGYSLFAFCKIILQYYDLDPNVHGSLCNFLANPKFGRFRDATVPRSWFKTSIATIGKPMWLSVRNPNIRVLIAMNTYDNAAKRVHTIKNHWESNPLLRQAFPELIPDFKNTRWSDACAEIKRNKRFDEGTYEAIGAGGAVISRHYDHIVEDDLVCAKKDDFLGIELAPGREDIEKAIGWHKLVNSLFTDPAKSTIDNIGTRWAVHDLKDYIKRFEPRFQRFNLCAEKTKDGVPMGTDFPYWPNRFGKKVLDDLRDSQGPGMYSTQYLNLPRDPAEAVFDPLWLAYYDVAPEGMNHATIVDLAGWGDTKGTAKTVVMTIGKDIKNNIWIRRYDRGKFTPTDVIDLMVIHSKQFGSHVYVEEIQYQRAIRHFAKELMEKSGYFYNLSPLPYDGRKNAKDLRIRTIQPIAKQGGLHIKPSMKELVNEYSDYPSSLTVDLLDCMGYVTQKTFLRPPEEEVKVEYKSPFLLESVIEELREKQIGSYPFSTQCPVKWDKEGNWYV